MLHRTHPLLERLNVLLTVTGHEVAPHSRPDYIEARRKEDPSYEPMPYNRITGGGQVITKTDDDSDVHDPITLTTQIFNEQVSAWWDCRTSYGILDLTLTRFDGPEDGELIRLSLTLVQGEDALDNDEFNYFGWNREVLRVELPFTSDATYDFIFDHLSRFLTTFRSDAYFPAEG